MWPNVGLIPTIIVQNGGALRTELHSFLPGPTHYALHHHPVVVLGANLKPIFHRCHLFKVSRVLELTNETIDLPLGCLQGGSP
jgi:hypothetical protein